MAPNQNSIPDVSQDQDFLKAPVQDQRAYLAHIDPDFAKAAPADQDAYLSHVTGHAVSTQTTTPPNGSQPSAPPQEGMLSTAWHAINNPNYFAKWFGVPQEEARLQKLEDQYISQGRPNMARLVDFQRRDIDPQTGLTQLLTPITAATMGAGSTLEKMGAAGRAIEAPIAAAFSYGPAKDVFQGPQPGETEGESILRRASDVGQVFLGGLGIHGSLAPEEHKVSVRPTLQSTVDATLPAQTQQQPSNYDPAAAFLAHAGLDHDIDKPPVASTAAPQLVGPNPTSAQMAAENAKLDVALGNPPSALMRMESDAGNAYRDTYNRISQERATANAEPVGARMSSERGSVGEPPLPPRQASTQEQQPAERPPQSPLDALAQLNISFNRIASFTDKMRNATTNFNRDAARVGRSQEMDNAAKMAGTLVNSLPPDALAALRDHVNSIASDSSAKADMIDKILNQTQNPAVQQFNKEAVDLKSVGNANTWSNRAGEEAWQPTSVDVIGRSILSQLTGQVPRVKIGDIKLKEHLPNVPDEEAQPFISKLYDKAKADHDAILEDGRRLIANADPSQVDGILHDSDLPQRMRALGEDLRYIGSFEKAPEAPGNRPADVNATPKTAPAMTMTKAMASRLLGRNVRNIPDASEFQAKASQYRELANLHKSLAKAIDAKIGLKELTQPAPAREGERGAVGTVPPPAIDEKRFDPKALMAQAKKFGLQAYEVGTDKHPSSGYAGWLSPDGKTWIDKGALDHWEVSKMLLPDVEAKGSAMRSMMDAGWIRKATPTAFEIRDINSKTTNAIEMDLIRSGHHGQDILLDLNPTGTGAKFFNVERGWESLDSAISKTRQSQAGNIHGTEIMAGMATGMAFGAKVGGLPGAAIGGVIGAVTPAILRSPVIADSWRYLRSARRVAGFTANDWFSAPKDNPAISPEMAQIRDAQLQSLKAPERQLSYRMSTLMGDMWHKLDPYAFITDRPNAIQAFTMQFDPRGKGFRDAKGQLSLDESPLVAVRTAITGMRGSIGVARQMYGAIERDATQAGLHGELLDYLNLKAYSRAYQVADEHIQALSGETQNLKQQLATETDVVKQVGLHNQIEKNVEALKEMSDNYRSGKIAPGGYDPPKIQRDLAALQQQLGPDKFAQIQDFAKRTFDLNRQALDIIADAKNGFKNGIISKEEYETYTNRGDEYIPMRRIMENVADNNRQWYGKKSPLYLRQQNVINQFAGSERVNVDPFQASADANAEAIREHFRNRTLGTFIDAAQKSPDIAPYFKHVSPTAKAEKGNMIVGLFRNGQQVRYEVPEWLGHSLDISSMTQTQGILHAINRMSAELFKPAVTTFSPSWVIARQLPNIIGRELVTAEGPKDPRLIASAFKDAFVSTWTHDDKWMEATKTGLTRNSLMNMIYPEARLTDARLGAMGPFRNLLPETRLASDRRTTMQRMHDSLQKPFQTIAQLSSLPSDVVQLGHFNRLRQAGYSPEAAAYKTQHYGPLPDYAQLGNHDGAMAIATTFLRADWAHIRSDLALATAEQYRGRLAMTMAAIAIPTLALVYHNIQQKDEHGNSLWDKVADTDKERYWVHLTGKVDAQGNPESIKIGKPDYVQLFGNPMEDAMYKMIGGVQKQNADTRPITQLIANTASRFIPGHPNFDANAMQGFRGTAGEVVGKTLATGWQNLTPALRLPPEEAMNKQIQFGQMRPIVTNGKLSPDMQGYGAPNVSPTAMVLGQKLGVSPQRIEHITRGMFGTVGRMGEEALDPLLRGKSSVPLIASQGSSQMSSPLHGVSIDQQEIDATNKFYNTVGQVSKPYADYMMLKKQNPSAAEQYRQQNEKAVWNGEIAVRLQQRVGLINSAQKELAARQMDPHDREVVGQNMKAVKLQTMQALYDLIEQQTNKTVSNSKTGNAVIQGTTR